MLDDHSAFDDAQKVVDGFAELASIHADLELANAQWVSLLPLRELATREQQQAQHLAHLQALQQQLPHWFAAQGVQWWGQRMRTVAGTDGAARCTVASRAAACGYRTKARAGLAWPLPASRWRQHRRAARERDHARKELARIEGHLAQYQTLVRNLGLGENASANDLPTTRPSPGGDGADRRSQAELQASAEHAIAQAHNATPACANPGRIRRRAPAPWLQPADGVPALSRRAGRTTWALPETDLPFAAELVEVRQAEQVWRGAIERALGSHRLRILVPRQCTPHCGGEPAAQPVLHVRLLEVRAMPRPQRSHARRLCAQAQPQARHPAAHLNTLRQLPARPGPPLRA